MNVGEEARGGSAVVSEAMAGGNAGEKADGPAGLLPPRRLLVELTIDGEPVAAPRPRVSGRHIWFPGNYTAKRDAIGMLMKTARLRRDPATGLVHLLAIFHRGNHRRSDADNYLKTILDAGNGILWVDDSQVVSGTWDIDWAPPPRTFLQAWSLGGGADSD